MKSPAQVTEDFFCFGQSSGHSEQPFGFLLRQNPLAPPLRKHADTYAQELSEFCDCGLNVRSK